MVNKEVELNSIFRKHISKLKIMKYKLPAIREASEWKEEEKALKKVWYKLVKINSANKYFGQEISETLYPEYFIDMEEIDKLLKE